MVFYAQQPGVDRGFMLAQRSGKCVYDVTKLYELSFSVLYCRTQANLPTLMQPFKVVRDSFGSYKMCQFFCQTYCLWHKQLENEIILGVTVLHFSENGSEHCYFRPS